MSERGKERRTARRSTAHLEKILHRDFHAPGRTNPEELLRAARVLADRDGRGDADRAWDQFQEKYRSCLTDGRSLYEDAGEPDGHQASVQTPPPTRERWRSSPLRALCAAAALAAVMLAAARRMDRR